MDPIFNPADAPGAGFLSERPAAEDELPPLTTLLEVVDPDFSRAAPDPEDPPLLPVQPAIPAIPAPTAETFKNCRLLRFSFII